MKNNNELTQLIPTGKGLVKLLSNINDHDSYKEMIKRYKMMVISEAAKDPIKFIDSMCRSIIDDINISGNPEIVERNKTYAISIVGILMNMIGDYTYNSEKGTIKIFGKKYKISHEISVVLEIAFNTFLGEIKTINFWKNNKMAFDSHIWGCL